jgi:protein-tyrosine phosphatase
MPSRRLASLGFGNSGLPVYVHCKAGVSRAVLVTVAYLMWREGWSRDKALHFVRCQRCQVRPNPAFMALLKKWELSLNGHGGRKEG